MIQDISPYKLDNQYDNKAIIEDRDFIIICNKDCVLVEKSKYEEGELVFPNYKDFACKDKSKFTYLFSIDKERYFKYVGSIEESDTETFISFREIRDSRISPKHRVFAFITAKHLQDWYRDNKFCGRCGHVMKHSETERAMVCPECGYTSYPRIMPAVIVGVINGDKILLTKYRNGFGSFALIAGFVEIGETIEEGVVREVMEEAGIRVKNITYYKSQPWGIPNDVLLGFFCQVDGDDTITMDPGELKYADWVKREDVVLHNNEYSLTNEMMKMFKEGKI